MTLAEVIDTARNIVNEPLDVTRTFPDDTSGFWTDSILTTYHNLIQQDIAMRMTQVFEDYFVTETFIGISSGQNEYTLPSDFVKMRRVEDRRNGSIPTEIPPVSINQKDETLGTFIGSGGNLLGGYYIKGTSIAFGDTPTFTDDSAIQMYYVKRLPDVTASSDSSEIPQEYHRALVWGVVKNALYQQQSDNNFAVQEYERHLARIKLEAENRQVQRPRQVKRIRSRRILT